MKKNQVFLGLVVVGLLVSGCGAKGKDNDKQKVTESTKETVMKTEKKTEATEDSQTIETTQVSEEGSQEVAVTEAPTTNEETPVKNESNGSQGAQDNVNNNQGASTNNQGSTNNQTVAANTNNSSMTVSQDGDNGQAGVLYKVVVTNTSDTRIEVNSGLFNLNKSSKTANVNENIPAQYGETRGLNPGESTTFNQVLGPISGDTPGYYYLAASYQSEVFWSQAPSIEDYK